MINRKLTVVINGKDVVCNYGVLWFYEHYKTDSGHDLVKDGGFKEVDLQSTQMFSVVQSLLWAGILTEASLNKVEPSVTRDDVCHYVMSGDVESISKLMFDIVAAISGVEATEQKEEVLPDDEKKN